MRRLLTLAALIPALPPAAGLAFFATGPSAEERAEALLAAQVAAWTDPVQREATTAALRADNPEWDFMRRTFLALAASDQALLHPDDPSVAGPDRRCDRHHPGRRGRRGGTPRSCCPTASAGRSSIRRVGACSSMGRSG